MIILENKNLIQIKEILYNIIQIIIIKSLIIMLKKEEQLSIEEETKIILIMLIKIKKIWIKFIIEQDKKTILMI